jgi:hypothetical protein
MYSVEGLPVTPLNMIGMSSPILFTMRLTNISLDDSRAKSKAPPFLPLIDNFY